MGHPLDQSGRAGLWMLVALALVGVAFLALGDPLGLFGGVQRDEAGGAGGELDGASPKAGGAAEAPRSTGSGTLTGLFGSGELGGVRVRVLDATLKAPRSGISVTLSGRDSEPQRLETDAEGVALFGSLAPGRGWSLRVESAGLRAVPVDGFLVFPGKVTDLGDVWIGTHVVLRGRVLDPSGRPLPKASVAAHASVRGAAGQGLVVFLVEQALSSPQPREEVTTDDGGWFQFLSLADGAYALVASHPGYGMRQQNDVVVSPRSASSPVVLRLVEGGRLKARVLDLEGRAVPGARVVALRDAGNRFSLTSTLERDEATADDKGFAELDTLVDGASYRMGVQAAGFASAWDQAPTEVLRTVEREFRLSRGGYVEGRVLDEATGSGVPDAAVTVVVGRFNMGGGAPRGGRGSRGGVAPPPAEPLDPTTPATARTDAEGRFRLGPLLPGPVMSAVIQASGFASTSASLFTGNAWPDVSLDKPSEVEVSLKRGGAIEGRVRTSDGSAVAGAGIVAVQNGNFGAMWTGSPSARSDAEGRYRVEGAPPGEYHLTVDARGLVLAATGEEGSKAVIPPEGGTATLDLVLSASGVIEGQVLDAAGEPMVGVRVRTQPVLGNLFRGGGAQGGAGGAGARMVEALRTSADLSDAAGRFRLTDVTSALEVTVEAEAEDYVTSQTERLKVQPGETKSVTLTLSKGATLSGRVQGSGAGYLPGARLRIATLDPDDVARPFLSTWEVRRLLDPRVFFSDADGRYLIPNVKPGRIMLQVEHEDYVTYAKRGLTLAADQVLEEHGIVLQRGEVAEGLVKGADGKPLVGAMVFVTSRRTPGSREAEGPAAPASDDVEPQLSAQTDADGRFRVVNIPPGTWSIVVGFAPGHLGYFGSNDEAAIQRDMLVPARDVEFRLKVQPAGATPFGPGGGRPAGAGGGTPPRPPR